MDFEEIREAGIRAACELPDWWREMPPGDQLRGLREDRGISQRQLADATGIKQSMISRLERGSDARLSTWRRLFGGLNYEAVLTPLPGIEEGDDLLQEEAQRRRERQRAGLATGKRRW